MALAYEEALDYVYSLINYELQRPVRYTPDVVSLERPRALMAALGSPQERYPVIHVTGTKGKGSVSAMCASVLQAAGLKVALYSSPHLQDFRERFRINNTLIAPEAFAALVDRIKPLVAQIPGLTWFEVVTSIGFEYFAQQAVDVAVIEVGLGGRLDATNILQKPLVSVITSLSYDHMYLLGNTLAEIAFEKGGIIKAGVPVVSAPQHAEGREVIERIAAERGAPLTLVGRDWQSVTGKSDLNGQTFMAGKAEPLQTYWTPLIGEHQAINATVALAALDQVRIAGLPLSSKITDEAIHSGLQTVNWPGRIEIVERAPWLVLDVAHNAESAERLTQALTSILPGGGWTLVFGAFTDKDVDGMFRTLLPLTEHLVVMKALNPRAFDTDVLADKARAMGFTGTIDAIPAVAEALARARELAASSNADSKQARILVTGSVSIVGEMRAILGLAPTRSAYLDQQAVQVLQG